MLTKRPRYSNTLLVSLNNRIYFRDHSASVSSGDRDASDLAITSRVRTAPSHFSGVEARSPILEVFKLETVSQRRDLEHGGSASINSDPNDHDSNASGPSHAPGDVIQMKTDPSIARSSDSTHGRE